MLGLEQVDVRTITAIRIQSQAQVTDEHLLGLSITERVGRSVVYTRTIDNFSARQGLEVAAVVSEAANHELYHGMEPTAALDNCMLLAWTEDDLCLMNFTVAPLVKDGLIFPRSRNLSDGIQKMCVPHLKRLRAEARPK